MAASNKTGIAKSKGGKTKLKLLYLYRMLEEETDDEHGLSMADIIERLAAEGITAERKSIYRDLNALRDFGYTINKHERNPTEYSLGNRPFKLSQLMLVIDAIESCKFLTVRQANMLEGNIRSLASSHQQALLERRIHVTGRRKTSKDVNVFESIDTIHEAMREGKKVSFHYVRGDVNGKLVDDGKGRRTLTPVSIVFDDGFYYLTTWSDEREEFVEYRIDRMTKVNVSCEVATRNEEVANHGYDDEYRYFGRFEGERRAVTLAVAPGKFDIVYDRFGRDASIQADGEGGLAEVKVRVSEQFFGWVAGLGGLVAIAAPQDVADDYVAYLRKLLAAAEAAPGISE